jgi:hypothetical protein
MLTADCIAAAAAVILFDMCVCVCDSLVPRPIITQQRAATAEIFIFLRLLPVPAQQLAVIGISKHVQTWFSDFLFLLAFVFLVILLVLFLPRLLINKSAGYLKRLSRHISPLFTDYWTCLMTERMQRAAP